MATLTPISIWDIPEQGTRGPKGRYDRDAVAVAAVRLADAGGLDAVTMRRVATELGIAPMSLYNYVPTKDHLIQLMVDLAAREYQYPGTEPADKRAAIADLARQGRAVTVRHPWLPDAMRRPGSRPRIAARKGNLRACCSAGATQRWRRGPRCASVLRSDPP